MKSKFAFLVLFIAALTSCKKTTNVDVTVSTSGKLTYKLTDDAGKGLPNVKVSLNGNYDNSSYYYYNSNFNAVIETRVTDINGVADFGDLNPGNYQVVADSAKVNNVAYPVRELVQVVAGVTKNKETKATDYSGKYVLTVKSSNSSQLLKNIGVLMIPSNKYSYSSSTSTQLKLADFSGVTDNAGMVTFKLPADKTYYVYLYNTQNNNSYNNYYSNNVQVQKDATSSSTMYANTN